MSIEERDGMKRDPDQGGPQHSSDSDFLREVKDLSEKCEDMDYYEVLGTARHATRSDLRKAYHSKVKKYHPDRFFWIQDEEFKYRLSKIFSRLNQAYSVLSATQTRQTYDGTSETKKSSADMARARFEGGLVHFRAGGFDVALKCFGQAVYLDVSCSKYHYYHGLTLKKFKRNKEAEQAFLEAIKKSPGNSDYTAELGYLYLELGMKVRAKRTFERALSISKDNKRALQGIAALME